jgi:enoyl-CoA hydratase/carnithine racemase
MSSRVHLERDGDVAVIVIDNPPINAGSAEVRRGLLEAVDAVRQDDAIARERGEAALRADLDWLAGLSGPGFVRGDVRHVLAQGA